jgi:tRNA (guanine-N(7)-)-methyltransferase subunit TRM82
MELSPDGNYVATADRDQKVRITCMPPPGTDLLHHRAHEIQSYCMGHRSFVTCTAWAQRYNNNDNNGDSSPSSSPPSSSSSSSSSLLLSGSGDGTIRVWHPLTGHLMNTLHITPPPPSSSSEQEEEKEIVMAVLNVAVSPDGQWVLAAVEGSNSLLLCSLLRKNSKNDDKTTDGSDIERVELTQVKWLDVPGLYLPTSVCFDTTATTGEKGGEYWRVLAAGGPPSETSLASFVCAGMISTTQDDDNNNKNGGWIVASYDDDSSLSAENLVFLEQHHDDDGKEGEEGKTREELGAQAAGRENLVNLRKSVYSAEEIALRKKARGVVITSC